MKHSLKIESPCHADWGAMAGDARKRHCGECRLDVYNFSEMTQREVDRALDRAKKRAAKHSDARLCVRYVQREDGSIVTKHCATGFRANLLRAVRWTSAMVAALISFVPGLPRAAKAAVLRPAMAAVQATTGRAASPTALVQIQAAAKPRVAETTFMGAPPLLQDGMVQVVGRGGRPMQDFRIRIVNNKTGDAVWLTTDNRGVARVHALPTGDYRIEFEFGAPEEDLSHVKFPSARSIRATFGQMLMGAVAPKFSMEQVAAPAVLVPKRAVEQPVAPEIEPESKPPGSTVPAPVGPTPQKVAASVVQVVGQNGMPMAYVQLRIVNNKTGDAVWFSTDKNGIARVHHIASGEYRIEFEQGEALNDVSHVTFPAATTVRVTYQYGSSFTTMGEILVEPVTDQKTVKPKPSLDEGGVSGRLTPTKQEAAGPRDSVMQVMSPDGYPMGFLQITLVNNETGDAYFFETDTHGAAHVQSIPSGEYRIGLYQGKADENLSKVTFPWATPVRATYRLVVRGGDAWVTEGPELDVQPQRPNSTLQELRSRRGMERPVPPEIGPNGEMMTPLGITSLALKVHGFGGKVTAATVVVTNDATHAAATGTVDERGEIRFVGLAEGMYTIEITATGRGTTTLHQRLPSMIPVTAWLPPGGEPEVKPVMGKVAIPTVKRQKE